MPIFNVKELWDISPGVLYAKETDKAKLITLGYTNRGELATSPAWASFSEWMPVKRACLFHKSTQPKEELADYCRK